jgi:1-deoxy-D-xylulose-5-phosphate reductoisomerase
MTPRRLAILGSTGSIGRAALRVVARHPERFRVVALTARDNATLLAEQVAAIGPVFAGLAGNGEAGSDAWHRGAGCLVEAAVMPGVDIVLNAVVGAAGLDATLAALDAGRRVALANKETLVLAGELATRAAARSGGEIVPGAPGGRSGA